jgi:hypothetical protein
MLIYLSFYIHWEKYSSPDDIDNIISAEILDSYSESELYDLVNCTHTIVDQDGYPIYKRRLKGITIEKNGITLDNQKVVPYNKKLLLKYQAHINMESCNQTTSI